MRVSVVIIALCIVGSTIAKPLDAVAENDEKSHPAEPEDAVTDDAASRCSPEKEEEKHDTPHDNLEDLLDGPFAPLFADPQDEDKYLKELEEIVELSKEIVAKLAAEPGSMEAKYVRRRTRKLGAAPDIDPDSEWVERKHKEGEAVYAEGFD